LPEIAVRLDPSGLVVPSLVAAKLADPLEAPDAASIVSWCRFAGWYGVGSSQWRTIAIAACKRIDPAWDDSDRYGVYAALRSQHMQGWSGEIGKLHPRFQHAIDIARKALEEEAEDVLKEYWRWRIAVAEADLAHEKERLEEGGY